MIELLKSFGLVRRDGDRITSGEFRLVDHLGLFLFCEKVSPSARLYYGQDSEALSRQFVPAQGHVLDLCAGAGAQALVAARTATSVTAVDIEPLAERVFRINAELNGLSHKVEYLVGDLLEPVAGRRFDLISCNPPFMPVPGGVRLPRFADGGPDGLSLVRRLLAGLPAVLAPGGRCHVVGAIFGDQEEPKFDGFHEIAAGANLELAITCLYAEELDAALLASYAATTMAGGGRGDVAGAVRAHFAEFGATRLYYYLLTASLSIRPCVYSAHENVQRVKIGRA